MKNPWESHSHIWSTKSKFFSYVRGGIRQGLWNKNPVKLEYIKKNRIQIPNPNPKGNKPQVWGAKCEACLQLFPIKEIEVDHKKGNHSLKSNDDLQEFIEAMIFVDEDDLQLVCKPCHKIISYSDRAGISYEESKAIKQAIESCKKSVDKQKEELMSFGFKEEQIKSAPLRRKCYESYYKGEFI